MIDLAGRALDETAQAAVIELTNSTSRLKGTGRELSNRSIGRVMEVAHAAREADDWSVRGVLT